MSTYSSDSPIESLDDRLAEARLNTRRNLLNQWQDNVDTLLSQEGPATTSSAHAETREHTKISSSQIVPSDSSPTSSIQSAMAPSQDHALMKGSLMEWLRSRLQSLGLSSDTETDPKPESNPPGHPQAAKAADDKMNQNKPRLLLMGQRRSGKSSITSVVFHKMSPQETLFLETTTRVQKDVLQSFMDFQIWDFPGQLDYFDPQFDVMETFSGIGALVWVIDAQDDYSESLNRLVTTILNLQTTFPSVNVEIFVHKIDSLNEELKTDIFQDIVQRVSDDLSDQGYINPNVYYHLTSIYDHSIFEAFSKVIQKLIPNIGTLENLLNILVNNSGMSKAYLFDILSKIYVASDTRPIDMEVYEMCSDYIDVIVDLSDLYNYPRKNPKVLGEQMKEVESSCTLHDGSMVYLKEMNRYLCLVAVIKQPNAKDKKGLIDYNCHVFQDALTEVFARGWEKDRPGQEGETSEAGSQISKAQANLQAQLE